MEESNMGNLCKTIAEMPLDGVVGFDGIANKMPRENTYTNPKSMLFLVETLTGKYTRQ